jgi:putative glycosyltransferase (TIGR04372 family)
MKKFFKAINGISSYYIFRLLFSSRESLVIETNIFGHAILESALLMEYVHENPTKKVLYVMHSHSANHFLTKSIIDSLAALNIKQSRLAQNAIHGQDILVNRIGIEKKIKTVQFQEDLTHLTASNLNEQSLPNFNFRSDLGHGLIDGKKKIILMNRSAAYKKFQESSSLHSYRDFDFSAIDSIDIKSNETTEFIRIGVPDGISTDNPKVVDRRQEVANDSELDIKIQFSASGYFGADSGPAWFALAMGKPVAFINMIPLNQISPVAPERLVVIPKLIYSKKLERLLTLSEMLSPDVSLMRSTNEYEAAGLQPLSNTNQDVSKFFNEWLEMLSDRNEIVNENYMGLVRKKFDVPNLPSIHVGFVEKYPEVFGIE